MTSQNRNRGIAYYRQHTDKLESSFRGLNAIQLVCLLVASIGSAAYLMVKFNAFSEWAPALASHPAIDILLVIIIWAFGFGARAYADARYLFLVQDILEND